MPPRPPEAARGSGVPGGRVLLISLHTSPVEQPGGGDAGGMNTYVLQSARALARTGVEVEMVTGTTGPASVSQVGPGIRLHALPVDPVGPGQRADGIDAVIAGARRFGDAVAARVPRCAVVHGHYWLSGIAAEQVAGAWGSTLVQSSHTLAAVKARALGDPGAEPLERIRAEEHLARIADRLVANTALEADQLVQLCGADPARVSVVEPGVDLDVFSPAVAVGAPVPVAAGALATPVAAPAAGSRAAARAELGLDPDDPVVAYVGRLQPLKGPDVLLRAAGPVLAGLAAAGRPRRLTVLVCGAPAGRATGELDRLRALAADGPPGLTVRFVPPRPAAELVAVYRAADVVAVPSRSESFGLVALEAQACGVPVVAADVGGLPRAVAPGAGTLVSGHDPVDWGAALTRVLTDPAAASVAVAAGLAHAAAFSWDRTAQGLLAVYRAAGDRSRAVARSA